MGLPDVGATICRIFMKNKRFVAIFTLVYFVMSWGFNLITFADEIILSKGLPESAYTCSGFASTTFKAIAAFDNDPASRWAGGSNRTIGDWIQVDFGEEKSFNKVNIKERSQVAMQAYRVEYRSTLEDEWVTACVNGVINIPANPTYTHNFVTAKGRYVRLYVPAQELAPSIYNFEVIYSDQNDTEITSTLCEFDVKNKMILGLQKGITALQLKNSITPKVSGTKIEVLTGAFLSAEDNNEITSDMVLKVTSPNGLSSIIFTMGRLLNSSAILTSDFFTIENFTITLISGEANYTNVIGKISISEGATFKIYTSDKSAEITSGHLTDGDIITVTSENLAVINDYIVKIDTTPFPPTVYDIIVIGEAKSGATLKADSFSYYDPNGDEMTLVSYQWMYSVDNVNYSDISNETNQTYIVKDSDIGGYIKVKITVRNDVEPSEGVGFSNAIGKITKALPKASGVRLMQLNSSELKVDYKFEDPIGILEGATEFKWFVSDMPYSNYTVVSGANSNIYTVRSNDFGKYIKAEVTPRNANGSYGDLVASSEILRIGYFPIPVSEVTANGENKDFAVDGKETTYFSGTQITIDLGSEMTFNSAYINGGDNNGYKIEYSKNSTTWQVIGNYANVIVNPAFSSVTARYVRVTPVIISGKTSRIYEIQIFNNTNDYNKDLTELNKYLDNLSYNFNTKNSDFYLPVPQNDDIVLKWSTNKPSVVNINGSCAVVTPSDVNENVELYMLSKLGDAYAYRIFYVVIVANVSDSEAVNLDTNAISFANTDTSTTFELPIQGQYGSDISWVSSNSSIVISSNYAVVRKALQDKYVTLTATVKKGSVQKTKSFDFVVNKINGGNLVKGYTLKADSARSAGNSEANANDGSTSTYWQSSQRDDAWIQVDFGSAKKLNSMVISEYRNYMAAWKIQWSNTADLSGNVINWVDAYSKTKASGGDKSTITACDFDTIYARYVRLYIVKSHEGVSYNTCVNELELYYVSEKDSLADSAIYNVDNENFVILGISPTSTVSEVKNNIFCAEGGLLTVADSSGVECPDSTKMANGMKLIVNSPDNSKQRIYACILQNDDNKAASDYCIVNNNENTIVVNHADIAFNRFMSVLNIPQGASLSLFTSDLKTEIRYGYLQTGYKLIVSPENASSPKRTYTITIDSTAKAPEVRDIKISGNLFKRQILTGSYTYYDPNIDVFVSESFRWLRADSKDGTFTPISDATSASYVLTDDDVGKYLKLEVSVVSSTAPNNGMNVSDAIGPIKNGAPVASNVKISGETLVGKVLTGSYQYFDPNNISTGTPKYRWLIGNSFEGNFTPIAGATDSKYTITENEYGKYIKFEVTPVNSLDDIGDPYVSSATTPIGRINLASGATASASSNSNSSALAIDSDRNTYWSPTSNDQALTITLNLNKMTTFNRAIIKATGDIAGYKVEYSNDNQTWTNAYTTRSELSVGDVEIVFPEVTGSYTRLTVYRNLASIPISVFEFQLYNNGQEFDSIYENLSKIADGISLPNNVTGDFILPSDTSATWLTDSKLLTIYGDKVSVNIPSQDTQVVISAILTKNNVTFRKDFALTVLCGKNDTQSVEFDTNSLELGFVVRNTNFTLPLIGANNTSIQWTSSDSSVINIIGANAIVTRLNKDVVVTLQAVVSKNSISKTKVFNITVEKITTTTGNNGGGGGYTSTKPSVVVTPNITEGSKYDIGFSDLDSVPWAKKYILGLKTSGIINGKKENQFAPNDNITREEFLKLIIEGFKIKIVDATTDFKDVSKEQWYYVYVASGQQVGIIGGKSDGTFGVGENISRQDMATMAYRACQITGKAINQVTNPMNFNDWENIEDYAKEPARTLQSANIINGMGDGMFSPLENATRAQAAKIIYMLIN